MQNLQSMRAYWLFIAGLLIGAFGVYFFGNVSTGGGASGFGVQSYEGDVVTLPSQGVIVDAEAFDLQCTGNMCESGCTQRGISPAQCTDMCRGKCEEFINGIKNNTGAVPTTTTQDTGFKFRGLNSADSSTKADPSIRQAREQQGVKVNEAPFIYQIDGQMFDEECVSLSCFQLCRNKGATEERCRPICSGAVQGGSISECQRLRAEGKLELNTIR